MRNTFLQKNGLTILISPSTWPLEEKSDSLNAVETKLLPLEAANQPDTDTDKTGDNFIFSLELADI